MTSFFSLQLINQITNVSSSSQDVFVLKQCVSSARIAFGVRGAYRVVSIVSSSQFHRIACSVCESDLSMGSVLDSALRDSVSSSAAVNLHLVHKSPTFCGTRILITQFTRARYFPCDDREEASPNPVVLFSLRSILKLSSLIYPSVCQRVP